MIARLALDASAPILILGFLITAATMALGWIAYDRSGRLPAVGRLELLRVAIVGLVAILLAGPTWIGRARTKTRPSVAILWDDSASMQTADVVLPGTRQATTRRQAISGHVGAKDWAAIDNAEVVVMPIGGRVAGEVQDAGPEDSGAMIGTDLHAALMSAASDIESLSAVVLISDGDWNSGKPPSDAATRFRLAGVPIYAVTVGSANRLPDVDLVSVDVPTFAATGKSVRIAFSVDSSLTRPFSTTVTMTTSSGQRQTQPITVQPGVRTSDWIMWTPDGAGETTVTVTIDRHPSETVAQNNSVSAPIVVRDESLKVLIVESIPRWEYRYLRNALSRDPGVDVACLLFHPSLGKVGGGSTDYLAAFPEAIEDLSKFDVVFLGDVGLSDGQLTVQQCERLKGLVEFQASGLVFMPGWQGRQFELLDTPLGELMPVVMDASTPDGIGSQTAGQFQLTQSGRRSLLTKLADTADQNVAVWEDLPGFQWHAAVVRAKAGADILAVHADTSNQYGRLPLVVTRTLGAGKILFMGTDGAWRWRKGVEDKYHYRFWGQVVRWMAYQRNMAKGETMRLYYTPDQPELGQTMALHAHVMDDRGEPVTGGTVVANITSPSGKIESVAMASGGKAWGVFDGRYTSTQPGRHRVQVTASDAGQTLEASFFVAGDAIESVGKPARPDVMDELARVSLGKSIPLAELDSLARQLDQLPRPKPITTQTPLWSHPLTAALMIVLMSAFWIGRKSAGLV